MTKRNFRRAAIQNHIRHHGCTPAREDGNKTAAAFQAALARSIAVHDPLYDETMRRAAEHHAKRAKIHALALKLARARAKQKPHKSAP